MFYLGDRVQLKSGGPLLTVVEISAEYSTVTVAWYQSAGRKTRVAECEFPIANLQPYNRRLDNTLTNRQDDGSLWPPS